MSFRAPATILFMSYPILAYLACDTAGYLWHEQLAAADRFSWITGDGVFNIYFIYYGTIVSCTLTTLFYDNFLLRWLTAGFFYLFLILISSSQQEIGYALPGLLVLLLAIYPKTADATEWHFKSLVKTLLYASSVMVMAHKILEIADGRPILNQYNAVIAAHTLSVFESASITFLLRAGPLFNHILELILLVNVILVPQLIFKRSTRFISVALLMLAFLVRLLLQGHSPKYFLFTLLTVSTLAAFTNFETEKAN